MPAALSTPLRLALPARAEYVAVVRGVLLVVAGRSGFTIDAGDDLALAVDEMCAALLAAGASGELTVTAAVVEDRVVVRVSGSVPGEWPPGGWHESTPALILEALVDSTSFGGEGSAAYVEVEKVADAT